MKKIVLYIQTSTMISYFVVPISKFLSDNYEIHVFHIDSINDCREPREFDNIIKHDVGNMSASQIKRLLVKIDPEKMIFINIYSLMELMMLRIVKQTGIKAVFLQHGVFEMNASKRRYDKLAKNTYSEVVKLSKFIVKYIDFLFASGHPLKELAILHQAFINRDFSKTKFDKAILFAPYWTHLINDKLKLADSDISYSGYPITESNEEFDKLVSAKRNVSNKAILIHQPFIKDKLTRFTYDMEKEYFVEIADKLKYKGLSLVLLLHPREDLELYKKIYMGTSISIIQNIEKEDYCKYRLAIGFYSTALFIPIFLNCPIWIIDYDIIKAQDSIFFPLSCDASNLLLEPNKTLYYYFKKEKIGLAECSSENIAKLITEC